MKFTNTSTNQLLTEANDVRTYQNIPQHIEAEKCTDHHDQKNPHWIKHIGNPHASYQTLDQQEWSFFESLIEVS